MSALPDAPKRMTEADYLAFERASDTKHEFVQGEIYAMAGASEAHNLIAGNLYGILYNQLRGRDCKKYPSDMKVRTPSTGSYVYPDAIVVCDEARFDGDKNDVLLNPTVIIEVLSPHTEAYDRGDKFRLYREIPSLQAYVLIAQDSAQVDCFVRQEGNVWQISDAQGLDATLDLSVIGCKLALADLYAQVDFEAQRAADNDKNAPETSE